MNGKGDSARPLSVTQKTFANNWEQTFRTDEVSQSQQEQESYDASTGSSTDTGKHSAVEDHSGNIG